MSLDIPGTDAQNMGLVTAQPSVSFTDGSVRPREGKALSRHHTAVGWDHIPSFFVPVWCYFSSSRLPLVNLNLLLESRRKHFRKIFNKKRKKYMTSVLI